MKRKAQVILLEKMPQKQKASLLKLSQNQSSSSSEDEGEGRYSDHNGWEDLSKKVPPF